MKHHNDFRTANLAKVLSRPTWKLTIRGRKGKQTNKRIPALENDESISMEFISRVGVTSQEMDGVSGKKN